jgi:hypothetical protein
MAFFTMAIASSFVPASAAQHGRDIIVQAKNPINRTNNTLFMLYLIFFTLEFRQMQLFKPT